MCSGKIKVLLVSTNKVPEVIEISNTLSSINKLISGKVEASYFNNDKYAFLIYDTESKYKGGLPNRVVNNNIIYSNFIVIGNDMKNGDFKSLNEKQIEKYQSLFGNSSITKIKNRLLARELAQTILYKRN